MADLEQMNIPGKFIVKATLGTMLRICIGWHDYTDEHVDKILNEYPELKKQNITSKTWYSLSLNENKKEIVVHKLEGHGGGRDCTILRVGQETTFVAGKDWIPKHKR